MLDDEHGGSTGARVKHRRTHRPPSKRPSTRSPFNICGVDIAPGAGATVDLPLAVLSNHVPMSLPVHVIHGLEPGPTLFVSAALHGDEILGVEIVRRLLRASPLRKLSGTLLAVPIVNGYGFLSHSRYLPDRRDLNRSFPGYRSGSLAGRLAHLFMAEVVERSDLGIDLHTAAYHRTNFPQVRISPGRDRVMELARAFGAPLILSSPLREGSLRQAAASRDVEVLVYEAGEALRFDELAIRGGLSGILRVMAHVGMIPERSVKPPKVSPIVINSSSWVRAPSGGIFRARKEAGDTVAAGETLGAISDPFGDEERELIAPQPGIIVGATKLPVINEGDALFHIADLAKPKAASEKVDTLTEQLHADPLLDEDEII